MVTIIIGRWRAEQLLHDLGQVAVYLATDGEREAVLHVARDPAGCLDCPSFIEGIEALRRIPEELPIARLLDGGATPSMRWTATEHFRGRPWARTFIAGKPIDALTMTLEALDIVKVLHAARGLGLLHGSFGPESIWMTDEGKTRLVNFGLAPLFRAPLAIDSRYRAPEHQRMPAVCDARTDVYGAGVTLFQLLTMRPPFECIEGAALWHCVQSLPICPDGEPIPACLRRIIQRATAKKPADRFPHVEDLRRAMIEALAELAADVPDALLEAESGERTATRTDPPDTTPSTLRSHDMAGAAAGGEPANDTAPVAAPAASNLPAATTPAVAGTLAASNLPAATTPPVAGPPAASSITGAAPSSSLLAPPAPPEPQPAPEPPPVLTGSRRPRARVSTWIAAALALAVAMVLARRTIEHDRPRILVHPPAPEPSPEHERPPAPAPIEAEPPPPEPIKAESPPPGPPPAPSRATRRRGPETHENPQEAQPSSSHSGSSKKFPWENDDPCAISWYRCGR